MAVAEGTRTWSVAVEYRGAPIKPYAKPRGELDPRVTLASMTIDGTSRTRICAAVQAEAEDEAREVGLAGIQWFARTQRLPEEPFLVEVSGGPGY